MLIKNVYEQFILPQMYYNNLDLGPGWLNELGSWVT